jgi:4-carboxymuconolactone decarboxylase
MARVPLLDDEVRPELAELCDRLRAGRRGSLINVYKILLNSPEMAEAWLGYMNAVRWGTGLAGRLREIITIRIAYLNDVPYVLGQHVPKLAEAEGLSVAECDALADWQGSKFFDEAERTALAYADAMTRDVHVPDDVFNALAPHYDDKSIVDLSILVGAYNMHTRVFTALQIDPEPAS